MCIVCNCEQDGDTFLYNFRRAQEVMKEACADMKKCAEVANNEDARRRYDKTHKHMVRVLRDWHKVEEMRENMPLADLGISLSRIKP